MKIHCGLVCRSTAHHGIPINATKEERETFKDAHKSMQQGFRGTLDQLDEYLTTTMKGIYQVNASEKMHIDRTENELTFTHIINAPQALVFKAWADPKHIVQWWGPHGFTNPVCELDVRPGGAILIHMRGPDGTIYPMTGVYHEIAEPERLVFTSAALDENGNPLFEVLNTITFVGHGGKTSLIMHASVTKVTPAAAPHLKGMDEGWKQSIERLEEHMAKI